MDVSTTVDRVDHLCNVIAGLAKKARQNSWPPDAVQAAENLAREIEQLAGELDGALDRHHVHALANAARQSLPRCFEAFGRAVAETLLDGADIKRHWRDAT